MNKKQFLIIKLVVVMLLAFICGLAIQSQNYIIPIFALIAAASFIMILSKKVGEVMADERDFLLAGKSARITIITYSFISAIAAIILMALRNNHPGFELVGSTLAYSVCSLLILQALLFKFFNKKDEK